MAAALRIGAVAYDPKVVTIWEGIQAFLTEEGRVPVEVELFLGYPTQVRALLDRRIDIAWNTNLAFVQSVRWSDGACGPVAMRDTDREWRSVVLGLSGGPVRDLAGLRGRSLALGSRDSGHASILPQYFLDRAGLRAGRDYTPVRHNSDVGKHGDTGTSELAALRALLDGQADAAAVGAPFWERLQASAGLPAGAVREIWRSPPFHHCMFTGRPGLPAARSEAFARALQSMRWEEPRHRPILEAEGLRAWVGPQVDGYRSLFEACEQQGLFERN